MSTTDERTGFRFPWESPAAPRRSQHDDADQHEGGAPAAEGDSGTETSPGQATAQGDPASRSDDERAQMITQTDVHVAADPKAESDAAGAETDVDAAGEEAVPTEPSAEQTASATAEASAGPEPAASTGPDTTASAGPAQAKSNRLMADLVRAMRTAAEESREASLEQVRGDAKAQVELIHSGSGDEVVELRRQSDEDVAAVREWSKAEIARIRSEADSRVEDCKQGFDTALEAHAATVERQIERVQTEVQRFEREMTAFFEQLEHLDDLGAFAAAAAHLPEPPDLARLVAEQATLTAPEAPDQAAADAEASARAEAEASAEAEAEAKAEAEASAEAEAEATAEAKASAEAEATAEADAEATTEAKAEVTAEAKATAEADAEVTADAEATTEASAEADTATETETRFATEAVAPSPDEDPRLVALRDSKVEGAGDRQTAEAAGPEDDASLGEDALAARLGILGTQVEAASPPAEVPDASTGASATTRVVVVGLVSVSSIASFKRHLAGVEGVRTVGVSSGPDGEFVFKVEHDPVLQVQDVLPTLPGFAARVVSSADGTIQVAASDPDLRD